MTYEWSMDFGPYEVNAFASHIVDKDVTGCSVKSYPMYLGGDTNFDDLWLGASFLVKDESTEERFVHVGYGSGSSIAQSGNYAAMTNKEGNLLWFKRVTYTNFIFN